MNDNVLKDRIKEDLTALGLYDYKNIIGFRNIFGKDKEHMSIKEIIDSMQGLDLKILSDLTERSLKQAFPKST
jgi:hypothetical protein